MNNPKEIVTSLVSHFSFFYGHQLMHNSNQTKHSFAISNPDHDATFRLTEFNRRFCSKMSCQVGLLEQTARMNPASKDVSVILPKRHVSESMIRKFFLLKKCF